MLKSLLKTLAIAVSVGLSAPVSAVQVNDLYFAEVPLSDAASEAQARETAFEQVMIKLTGNTAIMDNPDLKEAQSSSSRFVQQVGYGDLAGERSLRIAFEPTQLQTMMKDAQVSLWPQDRPLVLVWMIDEQQGRREQVWDLSNSASAEALKSAAAHRGLPVIFPVGDFDDRTAVSVSDLWGSFAKPIGLASVRYQPEAVLVVKHRILNGNAELDWTLYPEEPQRMQGARPEVNRGRAIDGDVFQQMIDDISGYFAEKQAVQLGVTGESGFFIDVQNVGNFEVLFHVERELTALPSVAAARMVQLSGDIARFELSLLASESQFENEWLALSEVTKVEIEHPAVEHNDIEQAVQEVAMPESSTATAGLQSVGGEQPTDAALNGVQVSEGGVAIVTDTSTLVDDTTYSQQHEVIADVTESVAEAPAAPILTYRWQ